MTIHKDQKTASPHILSADEGQRFEEDGVAVQFKVTSAMSAQQMGFYQIELEPGQNGAEAHFHRQMSETFFVLEGVLTVLVGEDWHEVTAGGTVFVPPGTVHAFCNQGDKAMRSLLIFTPCEGREGYFEGLFELLATKPDDMQAQLGALALEHDSFFAAR